MGCQGYSDIHVVGRDEGIKERGRNAHAGHVLLGFGDAGAVYGL